MKKFAALMLTALLLTGLIPALAEAPAFEPLAPPERVQVPRNSPEDATRSLPQTEEVVHITGDVFTITSKGLTLTQQIPFGWYGFSQDVSQQLDAYMQVFKDPRAALEYVFNLDLSLLLIDSQTDDQMMVYTRRNNTSAFFVSMGDAATQQTIHSFYLQNAPQAQPQIVEVAGRAFIQTLEVNGNGDGSQVLVLFTFMDGAMLGFQLIPQDGVITPAHEEQLKALIELATLPE